MMYSEKKFDLPTLEGLSKESVGAHLALYAGYVKNFNAIETALADEMKKPEGNAHILAELTRRLPFEFNGARLHEHYFSQWEGGIKALDEKSVVGTALAKQFGSIGDWEHIFKGIASMRGVGWAILYFDPVQKMFHNVWVDQHHQGHFATLPIILALDVWEHAFIADYGTTGRGKYIDACFKNYNWSVMEERYTHTA
jgi:superoxide dismutase, Fe-Mn family